MLTPLKYRYGTQYSFAHPLHAVEPDKPLDAGLLAKWRKRLPNCAAELTASTRGEYLQKAWNACASK